MAGISLLLPRETLAEMAKKEVAREGLDVKEIKYIVTSDAVSEARRAVAEGASIIIARGYQASVIKKYTNVPVIEITMTGQDLGILIKKAMSMANVKHPRIGLVGLNNMFANIDYFDDLFDVTIVKYFENTAENLQPAADRAVADGMDVIIGGDTAMLVAEQAGIPHLFLEATFDSIREAIKTAETAIYAAEVEKKHAAQIGAFLDNSFSGIIRINAIGLISRVNRVMEELLQKKEADMLGQSLKNIIRDMDEGEIEAVLTGKSDLYSSFIRMKGNAVVFILTAIKVEEIIDGGLLSCNIVKKKENVESDTLKEMYLHGFVAQTAFSNLKSKDRSMNECLELAKLYSLSSNPVLIKGELGSERNELAECIHNNSLRKNAPFITINCSDMTEEGQERMLFGERNRDKRSKESLGLLATANHGTVYIEEVENLSKYIQYKLFRIAQKFTLVQNDVEDIVALDIRLIATTNADLFQKMKQGEFREDLYYALCGLNLTIPPLRERPLDMEDLLTRAFKEKLAQYSRFHILTAGAREALAKYYWSGNKLQMEHFMDRMILTAKKRTIDEGYIRQLLAELYPVIDRKDGEERIVIYQDPKAKELTAVLEKHHGDRGLAAEELGISKTTLWRHMKKYGITGKYSL